MNLLNNAHDAVLVLSERWVELEVTAVESEVYFRVTDSGKGIQREFLSKLFTPFFTTKDIQYGTGLGLSISRSLAKKNKGELIYDLDAKNTSFLLQLPKAKVDQYRSATPQGVSLENSARPMDSQ